METWLFDRSAQQGRLELVGRDRLDLLHRMSTNDLLKLKPGEGCSTVLTTALARIIDRLIVYHRGETALALANQTETVRAWLQKHIFFQDQVKLRNVSGELGQLELQGQGAAAIVEQIAPGAATVALHHFVEVPDGQLLVARTFGLIGDGFTLIMPIATLEQVKASILTQGDVTMGDEARYEMLRIRAGLPGPGHELTEDYIPLEANLWDSVSFNKGCYIGQEIIARMESRNRLAKTLVSLRLDGPVPPGTRLLDGERQAGTLTSVAVLDSGEVVALGFVKPDQAVPGARLQTAGDGVRPAEAEVTAAPAIQANRQEK
jgi:folate-binding protein YgfZ